MDRRIHLALNVNDLKESICFYRKLFGTEPVKVEAGYANFVIADPPLKLTDQLWFYLRPVRIWAGELALVPLERDQAARFRRPSVGAGCGPAGSVSSRWPS